MGLPDAARTGDDAAIGSHDVAGTTTRPVLCRDGGGLTFRAETDNAAVIHRETRRDCLHCGFTATDRRNCDGHRVAVVAQRQTLLWRMPTRNSFPVEKS